MRKILVLSVSLFSVVLSNLALTKDRIPVDQFPSVPLSNQKSFWSAEVINNIPLAIVSLLSVGVTVLAAVILRGNK